MSRVLSGETLSHVKNPGLQGWKSCTLSFSLKLLLSGCSWWTTGSEDYGGGAKLSCGTQEAEQVPAEMVWCCSLALESDWIGNKWMAMSLLNSWDNGEEKHYFFAQVGGHILGIIREMTVQRSIWFVFPTFCERWQRFSTFRPRLNGPWFSLRHE